MGKYNFKVVEPRSAELEKAGFARVARLPFILDSRPGIHRDGSEYLVERGLGTWNPSRPGEVGNRPSEKSIRNYASWLCNFLEWCETRGVNPMNANYVDHINGDYQTELVAGLWGSTGRPLSPKTVNRYVDVATDFVQWMAAKGKRSPVVVPLVTRSLRSQRASATGDPRLRTHQVRKGRVTEAMRTIEQEIKANQGLYPSNGGALNLSELVRRSGIGPKTLFAASYKDTFKSRVVDPWLLNIKGVEAGSRREAKRGAAQRVSEWRELYGDLLTAYRISELDWQEARRLRAEAEERVQQLLAENDELRRKINQLKKGNVAEFPRRAVKNE